MIEFGFGFRVLNLVDFSIRKFGLVGVLVILICFDVVACVLGLGGFWVLGGFAFPRVGLGLGVWVFDLFVCLVGICRLVFLVLRL